MFSRLDLVLGLNGMLHFMTNGFIEMTTFLGQAAASFQDAQEIFRRLKGIEIASSQIQIVTEETGANVFAADMKKSADIFSAPEKHISCSLEKDMADDILYILMDGSAVNTRIQDENGGTWKEMKLGMVFRSKDIIKRGTKLESCTITKKEYVTYFGEVGKFKELLLAAAINAGYGTVKNVVVIGDGAHWIWNLCDECFPGATQILDYFHMVENVYGYANALYANDEKKRTKWAKSVIWYIETDQYKKAIDKVVKSPLATTQAEKIANLPGYLENNKDRVQYLLYKNNEYYIGSGMIEGGNKVVIQKRMKQCGMRWSINGGQYVAALRAKYLSNRWDTVEDVILGNVKIA